MAAWVPSSGLPFSMAAARVQLKLLDSAIFQKEQELEVAHPPAPVGRGEDELISSYAVN